MAKKCQGNKKEQETRTCFKCDKEGHIAKVYKRKQIIMKRTVQKESDNEDEKKEEGFGKDIEQVWYKRSPM